MWSAGPFAIGALLAVTLGGGPLPTLATAAYGPGATPASAAGDRLADRPSRSPVLSGDGRYVVFTAESELLLGRSPVPGERFASGLVRKDTATGAVELVAPPRRSDRATGELIDAGTPSGAAGVSRDGRYVLFVSRAALTADDHDTGSPDVYVRDMHQPLGPGAFELVSARDGATDGITYADPEAGSFAGIEGFALSADGRRAVFVTASASDLPARSGVLTPEWQVWVRDLDARTTRLVTRDRDDHSPEGAPADPPGAAAGGQPPTAAISADGRTVVWTTGEAQRQTPTLRDEGSLGPLPTLLVRVVDEPTRAARRVAGAVDLDDPGCVPATAVAPAPAERGPCGGPFIAGEGVDQLEIGSTLRLLGVTHDGQRVLFSSSAGRRPYDPAAHRPGTGFLSDLRPGVSRKAGVTVLWSTPQLDNRYELFAGALSADGSTATFVSRDNRFDGLQAVGSFPVGNLVTYNVFAVGVATRTVERVTVGHDGRDYSTGDRDLRPGGTVALSTDGSAVAFSADDGNLFVGDANGIPDVLVARRAAGVRDGGPRLLPTPHDPPAVLDRPPVRALPSRFLSTRGAVAVARRTGTATLRVQVPAAGRIVATATGTTTRTVRVKGRKVRRKSTVHVAGVRRTLRRAQTITLRIPVGRRARTVLRRTNGTIRVRLSLRYTPTDARASTLTRNYRLRAAHVRARTKGTR